MSTNPYAPPTAIVADIPVEQSPEPPFFAVSVFKLTVMSVCTLGLYQIYWFYRNWRSIRERDRSKILPPLRSIFAIFYCYPCFRRIRRESSEPYRSTLAAGPLAGGWIIVQLISQIPVLGLVSLMSFVFLIPVQRAVNQLNAEVVPSHDRNEVLTPANWGWIIVGSIFLLLAIVGTFLTPEM
jgi:hypothetical protein